MRNLTLAHRETGVTSGYGKPTKAVWDGALRLFHWALVACIAGAWATQELGPAYMDWHMAFGCTALALIVWRVAWGFLGPRTARFADFVRPPGEIYAYAKSWRAPKHRHLAGHNPIGGLSIVLMLFMVAIQAVTGLGNSDDILFAGPWHHTLNEAVSNRMSYIHSLNFWLLATIIFLHVVAIATHWLVLREDLVTPMLTGRKPDQSGSGSDDTGETLWPRALVLAILSAAAVGALIALAPAPPPIDLDMF